MRTKAVFFILSILVLALFSGVMAAQDDVIEIDFWNWWGVQREPLMNEIIEGFRADYPNVQINNVVQGWDRRAEVVLTAMASDPPEVMMVGRAELVRFAAEGLIVPITKYVEEDGLDLGAFYDSEIETMWWDGELYSMPMPTAGGETSLYIYDKDAFAAAGLDPDNPPTTWQEFWDASAALNERDGNVINTLAAEINVTGDNPAHGFLSWLYTNNGALYSEDLRSVAFNSAEGVETLQWMLDYINEFYGGIENIIDFMAGADSESPEFPLFQGRMGVMFPNVSIFGHLSTYAPDLNYGVALRPYNADNPDAASQGIAPLGFGWGYVIPAGLDEATERAAYNWVRRITYDMGLEDAPGACFFMQEQARPSPLIECNADPVYYELNPAWDNVITALESDVALPIVPPQSRIIDILNQYVELAFFGEFGPQEALDTAAEEANAILDEYWSSIE